MATAKVMPGAWVRVLLPTDSWPVKMAFGDGPAEAAFVEHVRGRRDNIDTYAAARCPQLRPGPYTVRAFHDDGITETRIEVV